MESFLPTLLQGLAVRTPIYVFCIVGLLVTLARWRRHPRVSLLAFLGIGRLFFGSLGAAVWYGVLPVLLSDSGLPAEQIGWIYSASGFGSLLLDSLALSLLLVATFIDRQQTKGF
jgi:hypothetical protein